MRFAICTESRSDREALAALIKRRLRALCADVGIDEYASSAELLSGLRDGGCTVLLLDADLECGAGLEVARRLKQAAHGCRLIMFAADTAQALRSYSVHPVGYLVKPFDYGVLCDTLDWCRSDWNDALRCISLSVGRMAIRIPVSDIIGAEIQGRSLRVSTCRGDFTVSISMSEFQRRVENEPFIRCHKSFMVNLYHVRGTSETGFVLDNGREFPVSTDRRRELTKEYEGFKSGV